MIHNIYEAPKAELFELISADVITTSTIPAFTDSDVLGDGWIDAN